ncbi:MAG: hypothetical protein M5U22_07180 [Thermoleophilia bacterium]|nr:hypothetical protein [Thermoleophilia bacterium]
MDPDTAIAVEAAQAHGVVTWEELADGEYLADWVRAQYIGERKTELPFGSYLVFADPATVPPLRFSLPEEDEVRACFAGEAAFTSFTELKDYTYGLADVTDEEFEACLEAVEEALGALVDSGQVAAGSVLHLEAVPHGYLHDLAIGEGEWLDRHVLLLAEYGALPATRGFEIRPPLDDHPLAWHRILRDRKEINAEEAERLLAEADRHLERCPGKTRKIDGRPYLRLADYRKWRSRWVKGRLDSHIKQGFVRESWNRWVSEHASTGPAELAGVAVKEIADYSADFPLEVVSQKDELQDRLARRARLLAAARSWTLSDLDQSDGSWTRTGPYDRTPFREQVAGWCNHGREILAELGEFLSACHQIERRYLAGHSALYPDAAADLDRMRTTLSAMADIANEGLVAEWEGLAGEKQVQEQGDDAQLERIDVEGILDDARGGELAASLVDSAKAEALSKLGEKQAAEDIVRRQLTRL